MVVTHKLILEGMSGQGGWNSKQIQLLGLEWPPKHGWHRKVIGRHISEEDYNAFLEAKGKSFRKERYRSSRANGNGKPPVHQNPGKEPSSSTFVVYSDGGGKGTRKIGAWAYIVVKDGIQISEKAMSYRKTTTNRMEFMGALAGIVSTPEGSEVLVRSDSSYVVNTFSKGWGLKWTKNNYNMVPNGSKKRPNWDLVSEIFKAISVRKVRFEWVKGHSGNKYNEKCDRMATQAMKDGLHADDLFYHQLLLENGGKW